MLTYFHIDHEEHPNEISINMRISPLYKSYFQISSTKYLLFCFGLNIISYIEITNVLLSLSLLSLCIIIFVIDTEQISQNQNEDLRLLPLDISYTSSPFNSEIKTYFIRGRYVQSCTMVSGGNLLPQRLKEHRQEKKYFIRRVFLVSQIFT